MTRRQALRVVGLVAAGAGIGSRPGPAWAERLASAQRSRPVLTIDLGQWDAIIVRHPIYGREPYAIDPAEIARALAVEDGP
jgi:hypothetical protein